MQNPPRDERTQQRRLAALDARIRTLETASRRLPVQTYAADHTAGAGDDIMQVSAASGSVTITLPTAVGAAGKSFMVERTDATTANAVTVAAQAGETINGAASFTQLWAQYMWVRVISDGTVWQIIGRAYIPEPYQSPSLGSNWASGPTSGSVFALKYWRDGLGNVNLVGSAHSTGSPSATMFTLPSVYRPTSPMRFGVTENFGGAATAHFLEVNSSGAVSLNPNFSATNHDIYIEAAFPLA